MSELTAREERNLRHLRALADEDRDNPATQACLQAAPSMADVLRNELPDISDATTARVLLALGMFHANAAQDNRAVQSANIELFTALHLAEVQLA